MLQGGTGPDSLDTKDRAGQDKLDGGAQVDTCLADSNDSSSTCP